MIKLKETKEYYNQRIDCDVKTCKFQDEEESRCSLGKIQVSGEEAKKQTFCDSFEEAE